MAAVRTQQLFFFFIPSLLRYYCTSLCVHVYSVTLVLSNSSTLWTWELDYKLALVIRIRSIGGICRKVGKLLQLVRLCQIFSGTCVKLSNASVTTLRTVEPYTAWESPDLRSVNELIYKCAYGKTNKKWIDLTDNTVIARSLGKDGIICMENQIHEICTVGKCFKDACNFLWHFKLSSPRGGMKEETTHFVEGRDAGNREDQINRLIRRMN